MLTYARTMSRDANLLGALATAVSDELDRADAAGTHLTRTQSAALNVVASRRGGTIRDLADALELSHPGAVRLVDRLQEDGYLERRAGQDARSVALHLTPAGRRLWNRQRRARDARLDELVSVLPRSSRSSLRTAVEILLAELAAEDDAAATICRRCDVAECPQARCPVALSAT